MISEEDAISGGAVIDILEISYYSNYMKIKELKVARIGNSRGIRLPASTLARYRVGATLIMEERAEGIMLLPQGTEPEKLSWEETAREMALAREDWSAWEAADSDGMDCLLPETEEKPHVAESEAPYRAGRKVRTR